MVNAALEMCTCLNIVFAVAVPPIVKVNIYPSNSADVKVSWGPIIAADVDYYIVYLNETNNSTAVKSYNLTSAITTQEFKDLVPGRSYQASITAYSGTGSQPSAIVTARTLPPKVNVTIGINSTTVMNVSWAPIIAVDVDYYIVYLKETNNPTAVKSYDLTSTITSQVFIDLVPGRSYQASVTAHSGTGSQPSNNATARTLPPKVTVNITIHSNIISPVLTVSWVAPTSDVDKYTVYLNETETNYNTSFVNYPNVSSFATSFSNLSQGMNYSASVIAYSGNNSQESDIVSNRTYPAPVREFKCFQNSFENIYCNWSLPIGVFTDIFLWVFNDSASVQNISIFNDKGSSISTSPDKQPMRKVLSSTTTNKTFTTIEQLKPNTRYTVSIAVIAGSLQSPIKNSTAYTDVTAPPAIPESVKVDSVPNTVTSNSLTLSFSCSWFATTNGDLKYFTVIVKESAETTTDKPENISPLSKYSEYKSGSTKVYQVDDRVYPAECKSLSAIVPVKVGTGATNGGFVDGALMPNTKYRFSFRAYTYIPGTRSVRAGKQALFADTFFSLPIFTLVGPTDSGAVAGGVIGGLLGGVALAAGGFFLYKKRNQLQKESKSNR
ncbi:receptor-type tyrosine-protein phosphatase beta-like [Lampetra planeri]